MKNTHVVSGLLAAVLLPFSLQGSAQETITDCQAIQDRLARYACYDSWDAASGVVRQAPRPQATPAQTNSGPRIEQQQEEEGFLGRIFDRDEEQAEEPQVASSTSPESELESFGRPQSNARLIDGLDGKSELIDTVVALDEVGPSMLLVTLAGGQQWRQMLSKRYYLQVGDEIRVYPTRWGGSYRLSSERVGGYIQVERVDSGGREIAADTARESAPAQPSSAPRVQQQEEEDEGPGFFGRIGGIFDRDSDDEEQQEAPAQVASSTSPESELENFGRPQTGARIVDGLDGKSELVDTVVTLDEVGPSQWMVTLAGGQRWRQMLSKRYTLQVGDEVRIYPTRWGSSFRLSAERVGGYIQVERVD